MVADVEFERRARAAGSALREATDRAGRARRSAVDVHGRRRRGRVGGAVIVLAAAVTATVVATTVQGGQVPVVGELPGETSSPSSVLGLPAGCEALDPEEVTVSRSPVGASLGAMLEAGLEAGYALDVIVVVEATDPGLEGPWSVVAAVVRHRGEVVGTGLWHSPDPVATLDPASGTSVEVFAADPLSYPGSTHITAANELAEHVSIFAPSEFELSDAHTEASRCAEAASPPS